MRDGIAGWVIAIPTPIRNVIPSRVATDVPAPRNPDATASTRMPRSIVRRAPARATSRDPGTAAAASRTTGRPVRTAVAVSVNPRSR